MDTKTYQMAVELRDRLRAELEENETYRALQHAEALVAMWGDAPSPTVRRNEPPQPTRLPASKLTQHIPGSRTSVIVGASSDYLRRKGSRATSGEILAELNRRSIPIGGKDPSKGLSSYLSHSPVFDNVLGQGYGLVEWSGAPQPSATVSRVKSTETQGYRWRSAAENYLREKGSRAESGEIQAALVRKGIMPHGNKPLNFLSSYLSQAKDIFDNIRGQGYGLREWSTEGQKSETPGSGELSGAPRGNGALPLNL